ncbi:MAG: hypothetical protein QOK67_08190 [Nitrososphaeraceae archaeon]|nr:hypothetical protein [Nitrososphaeraceae archaeon]
MIIEQYGKKQHSIALNEWYIKVGFISGVFLLLSLLSATNPSSDHTMVALAQEQNNNTNASTSTTSPELNSTQVDFVSNMEQIRGHLNAAVMNKEAGNNTLAKAHTLHPIAEIYSSIEPQISNTNATLNETLATNLNQFSKMVNTSSVDEFDTQSQKINGLLNQTVLQVIPNEIANNNTFKLGVVSDLLSIAGVEYGEAVENGTITEIVEYQDGQAFVSRAQDVFGQASPLVPQEMNNEVQETNQFFSSLNNAIQNKSNPEVADRSIGAIIHELSEITGISEAGLGGQGANTESGEIISKIRSLLNQTVEAYNQQNYAEAEALATTAYLDNFEFIEAPLAEKDPELMENTEVMLREQLRQFIQNKVPEEEIQQHIDKINSNLDKAEGLLAGGTS